MLNGVSIGTRLGAGFSVLVFLLGVVVAVAIHEGDRLDSQGRSLLADRYPKTIRANTIIDLVNEMSQATGKVLLADEIQQAFQDRETVLVLRGLIDEELAWLGRHEDSAAEKRLLDAIDDSRASYLAGQDRLLEMVALGDLEMARDFHIRDGVVLQDSYIDDIASLIRFQGGLMAADGESIRLRAHRALRLLMATSLVAVLLAIAVGIWITRSIVRSLAAAVGVANQLATGDLAVESKHCRQDEIGQFVRALSVMAQALSEDRARRLVSEQALRDSERRYRLLAEHSSDMICLHSADCRYTYVSPACVALVGCSQDQLIGRTPMSLIDPADLPGVLGVHDNLRDLAAGADYTLTFRIRRPDGDHRWVEVVGSKVCDPETGQTTEIVSVMRDVTARHEAEQRARDSAELLARSQRQAHLGGWSLDLPSQHLVWTEETYRIFGMVPGSSMDVRRFLASVHPDDRNFVEESWTAALGGQDYDIQHRLLVDGEVRWVRQRSTIELSADGQPLRALGTVQEITVMKGKEAELERSRALLRDLAAHREHVREQQRSHIAREIHDGMGQYLTALRMDLAMLPLRFGHHDPDIAQHVGNMKRTIDLTMEVVREVAAALRPPILDEGLLPAMEWLLAGFSERTGVIGKLEAPEQDIELDGDLATAVFRILQESLTNVTRHAQATRVTVAIQCHDGMLRMQVCDDGVGFNPDEAFQRRTFGLLGMHERALMFGGTVSLESVPQQGTTLLAVLPLPGGLLP